MRSILVFFRIIFTSVLSVAIFPMMLAAMGIYSVTHVIPQDLLEQILTEIPSLYGAEAQWYAGLAERISSDVLFYAVLAVLAGMALLILILNPKKLSGLLVVSVLGISCGLIFIMLGSVGDVMFASFIENIHSAADIMGELKAMLKQTGLWTIYICAGLTVFKFLFGNVLRRRKAQ